MVKLKKAEAKEAHVLDVGSGTGLFGMMAARAGADSVVANDLSEVLCTTARRVRPSAENCLPSLLNGSKAVPTLACKAGAHAFRLGININDLTEVLCTAHSRVRFSHIRWSPCVLY